LAAAIALPFASALWSKQAPHTQAAGVETPKDATPPSVADVRSDRAGRVVEVRVRPGQVVRTGDVLFVLDAWSKRSELAIKQAELALAETQLARLTANRRPVERASLEKAVEAAEWCAKEAEDRLERALRLGRAVAAQELFKCRADAQIARSQHEKAIADLDLFDAGCSEQERAIARVRVLQARYAVEQVEAEIEHMTVRAPANGDVAHVKVRVGDVVTSLSGPPLVVLGSTGS
jgi:multidrug resistance efflux pump